MRQGFYHKRRGKVCYSIEKIWRSLSITGKRNILIWNISKARILMILREKYLKKLVIRCHYSLMTNHSRIKNLEIMMSSRRLSNSKWNNHYGTFLLIQPLMLFFFLLSKYGKLINMYLLFVDMRCFCIFRMTLILNQQ